MNVSLGARWESFVEEREARLAALRETLDLAIAEGGELAPETVKARLDARLAARRAAE